ncbi:aspartate/glutamate racemase family protein [Pusillimonas sp. TS35]|uniref:aspartate/glutamate racemase family protein n=1 Tax=Paracandidimonas lactea TaxID=2895524 RepID=UPI001371FE68|nr:aspartate/glutamate racemase family protein [Paracandidimonas lactea]MYN12827.1 aspartate/glutamate racemase family protein [Pusillimonas sp. TS35]
MNVLIVNPNASSTMTDAITVAAQCAGAEDIKVRGVTNHMGPSAIQGVVDGARAVPGLLDIIAGDHCADAFIIACFDDTGLDAARSITSKPVVGIGEAAYYAAACVAEQFSVVTTLPCSTPILRANLQRYGLLHRCASVLAANVPVLDLEHPSDQAVGKLRATIRRAIDDDGATAIVLGCAGMAALHRQLGSEFGVPIIDGVASAVGMASSLVRMGARTARAGLYAPPTEMAI